jgi:crotonobetainyl-CoA:carnitine CoA-transferase CaiB-like acyl-CoA transferase
MSERGRQPNSRRAPTAVASVLHPSAVSSLKPTWARSAPLAQLAATELAGFVAPIVSAGPVLNVDEAMAADHTAHRKMVTELGAYRGLGTPIKLSRTPGGTRSAPPRFNEHGDAVLRQRGFSDAEIAALASEGVLVQKRRK